VHLSRSGLGREKGPGFGADAKRLATIVPLLSKPGKTALRQRSFYVVKGGTPTAPEDSDEDSDDHSLDDAEDKLGKQSDSAEADEPSSKEDDDATTNGFDIMDDTPVLVQRGLYIGTYRAEQNKQKLLKTRITDVLQVGSCA
jgi:hypothetical protein